MCKETLSKAVQKLGGQVALASAIRARIPGSRVEQGHVWKWLNLSKAEVPPAECVIAIAAATGWEFTPHALRPDLYPNATDALPPGAVEKISAAA
jgi:DNA-binding transcriptional regulator YdaS (Cro superfamily)